MNKQKTILLLIAALAIIFTSPAFAANIDPLNDDSQYAYGENVGWFNFEPGMGDGVTVEKTQVTGYVWQENIGWINLGPMPYGGVTNDGVGNLSGYAWGENVGWISFSCANTSTCAEVDYKVTIDANGNFQGFAWGENIGWISFNSGLEAAVPFKVQTAWLPSPTPYGLTADSTMSCGEIQLNWIDNSDNETGFSIERASDPVGQWGEIDTVGANVNTYTDMGLGNSAHYYYRVRAQIPPGYSEYSNIAYGHTRPATSQTDRLVPPTGLTATAVSLSQIDLSWHDNSIVEGG